MSTLDIVDELAALLEASAVDRDGSGARPVEYAPGLLYIWPRTDTPERAGMDFGAEDQINFRIRAAWAVDATEEIAQEARERTSTNAIFAKVEAYEATIRGHRDGTHYDWVQVDQVDYESLITNSARGFYLDLSGYTITG